MWFLIIADVQIGCDLCIEPGVTVDIVMHNHMRTSDKSTANRLYYDYPKWDNVLDIYDPICSHIIAENLLICYRSICHQLQTLINVHLVWMCWELVHVSATTAMDMLWHIQQVENLLL